MTCATSSARWRATLTPQKTEPPTGFFQGGELVSGAVNSEGIGSGGWSTSHSVFGVTDAVGRGLSKTAAAWVRESPFAGRI